MSKQPSTFTQDQVAGVSRRTFTMGLVERFRKYAAFAHFSNMTGQPAASIPMGVTEEGLPLAVMLVARTGEGCLLFGACAELEAAKPWFHVRPSIT